uniref:protein NLP7-like n=1 Tax=Erigeron canadensis TaxID=72917 RepID=UPI001CB933ED|nr:protein NLP7-like [Erigeron canadensis]
MSEFLTDKEDKEEEEDFLKTFPTFRYKLPNSRNHLWVFWSQDDHHEVQQQQQRLQINNNTLFSADVHTRRMISEKIKHAFFCGTVNAYRKLSIIQFWTPVMTISGRRLLSTSGQPFAVRFPSKKLSKYRLRCMEYQYIISDQHNDHDDLLIISDAPTATSFLNRLPELVSYKNLKGASPLVDSALECHLSHSYMLPICFPFQTSTSCCCIGVLEFSIGSILWFNENIIAMITRGLKEVGVGVFQIQERIPYQIIPGLKPARDEIEQALKFVCGSNNTPLAQVWVALEDDNHVKFSSYLQGTRKKQKLSLKLTGYIDDACSQLSYGKYYRLCDMFPLEMGEDFVEKTLEDYKPRFCNDGSKLSSDTLVKRLFDVVGVSRLAICFNSIHTGDFCYVFEFIWKGERDCDVKFVEKLLLKLKDLLPGFKLASGAELGDELDILKVGDSRATETKYLKIFQGKRLSLIPEVLEEGTRMPVPIIVDFIAPVEAKYKTTLIPLSLEVIEQQFGNTEIEAAKNLNVSRSTLRRKCRKLGILKWKGRNKRKLNDQYNTQSDTNEEDTGTIQESLPVNRNEHTLTIKAECAGDMIKFRLHIFQATFETVMEEIGTRLKMSPGTYKVKYLDEDKDWILLTSEQDISDCIKTSRNSDQTVVRLNVEPSA